MLVCIVAHCVSWCNCTAVSPPPQICVEQAAEDGGDGGGGNFIVIVPGANYLLSPEHVAEATDRLQGAKVILVSKPNIQNRPKNRPAPRGKIDIG